MSGQYEIDYDIIYTNADFIVGVKSLSVKYHIIEIIMSNYKDTGEKSDESTSDVRVSTMIVMPPPSNLIVSVNPKFVNSRED
jgi:hypothetical protein